MSSKINKNTASTFLTKILKEGGTHPQRQGGGWKEEFQVRGEALEVKPTSKKPTSNIDRILRLPQGRGDASSYSLNSTRLLSAFSLPGAFAHVVVDPSLQNPCSEFLPHQGLCRACAEQLWLQGEGARGLLPL